MLGQPLSVNQVFFQHHLQDGADEHQFGARDRPQPQFGVAGQFHFPTVDNNQGHAGLGSLLDGNADHVVALGEVGVENQDAVGVLQVPDGVGGAGVAQHVFQAPAQVGLHVAGMVQAVGLHPDVSELLGQIKLLVGAVSER